MPTTRFYRQPEWTLSNKLRLATQCSTCSSFRKSVPHTEQYFIFSICRFHGVKSGSKTCVTDSKKPESILYLFLTKIVLHHIFRFLLWTWFSAMCHKWKIGGEIIEKVKGENKKNEKSITRRTLQYTTP